eukprot:326963-Pyramimonas_sp.AAC.1
MLAHKRSTSSGLLRTCLRQKRTSCIFIWPIWYGNMQADFYAKGGAAMYPRDFASRASSPDASACGGAGSENCAAHPAPLLEGKTGRC